MRVKDIWLAMQLDMGDMRSAMAVGHEAIDVKAQRAADLPFGAVAGNLKRSPKCCFPLPDAVAEALRSGGDLKLLGNVQLSGQVYGMLHCFVVAMSLLLHCCIAVWLARSTASDVASGDPRAHHLHTVTSTQQD